MKPKSTAPRSFLRQLAEPIPRTAAPLIPRLPAVERGAATRSSLDAIPQFIDLAEKKDPPAVEPQYARPARHIARRLTPRSTATKAKSQSSQVDPATSAPAAHAQPAKQSSANAAETILRDTMLDYTGAQTKIPPEAMRENAQLQSALAHSVSTQATSPLLPAPRQTNAKTEKRPGIDVHIGTIEVRVSAPPTRTPQPAPPALNTRNTGNHVPSRASEPLSRSLAWSHGLVQG